MPRYDLVVIGGGPAGVTAALRAKELGATVALIERDRLGGTCTNDGCVPTRVLAKAARLMRDAAQMRDYGIELPAPPTVSLRDVLARTQQVVYQVHEKKQLLDHLRDVGIDAFVEQGPAAFVDPHTVQIGDHDRIEGERFIICAGGSARRLDFIGAEHTLTHSDVWALEALPARVVIMGGGATGCQLASVLNAFGSHVTILEVADRILLSEDDAVAALITDQFRAHGIAVLTETGGVQQVVVAAEHGHAYDVTYTTADGAPAVLPADAVIQSVGWPGNLAALNLGAAGVATIRSLILTDDHLRTTVPHIYAAGDITGRMMLVQSASYQARVAVENALLGGTTEAQHRLVPHGGFTDPEYGGVGLTEAQARADWDVSVATVPYSDLDRAVIDGHVEGFCKLIVDQKTLRVLGAHVVGEQAVEIVSMVATGIAGGLTIRQFADLEFAYPTFSAVIGLAARQIVRQLGVVPVTAEWRELAPLRPAEWERRD